MNNNDVFRRLRYALDLRDATLMAAFAASGLVFTREQVRAFAKHEVEPDFQPLSDAQFGAFLDGFVLLRRGPRPGAAASEAADTSGAVADGGATPTSTAALTPTAPTPATTAPTALPMNNNRVLRALRIALDLKDTDLLALLARANLAVTKTELSALFRRPDHRHFQVCGDQFLRSFLQGLAMRTRGEGG